jgi:hypothetical protein
VICGLMLMRRSSHKGDKCLVLGLAFHLVGCFSECIRRSEGYENWDGCSYGHGRFGNIDYRFVR